MFESLLPSQTLFAARHIATAAPTVGDEFDSDIATRYPHLSPLVRSQLAAFDRKVARDGRDSLLDAPILPQRIRDRHPLAN